MQWAQPIQESLKGRYRSGLQESIILIQKRETVTFCHLWALSWKNYNLPSLEWHAIIFTWKNAAFSSPKGVIVSQGTGLQHPDFQRHYCSRNGREKNLPSSTLFVAFVCLSNPTSISSCSSSYRSSFLRMHSPKWQIRSLIHKHAQTWITTFEMKHSSEAPWLVADQAFDSGTMKPQLYYIWASKGLTCSIGSMNALTSVYTHWDQKTPACTE